METVALPHHITQNRVTQSVVQNISIGQFTLQISFKLHQTQNIRLSAQLSGHSQFMTKVNLYIKQYPVK